MTPHLVPCPGCTRHVRVSETLCPFCATALPDELRARPPRPLPAGRLSRAATYAFGTGATRGVLLATGAAIASVTLSACSMPTYGLPPRDLGLDEPDSSVADAGHQGDAGPVDGAPADIGTTPTDLGVDTGLLAMYGGPPPIDAGPQDAGVDTGVGIALYGAPPA